MDNTAALYYGALAIAVTAGLCAGFLGFFAVAKCCAAVFVGLFLFGMMMAEATS
jgi:hypothetical protein